MLFVDCCSLVVVGCLSFVFVVLVVVGGGLFVVVY